MELTINNITKQYGNVTVLDDVSYRFTPGIYGILGANGAGKTTLFRIICGLMRANCGNIQYDHKDIGTKSQQALKLQQEQNNQERKERNRKKKEAEEQRMFELKQQKKREKHKGH